MFGLATISSTIAEASRTLVQVLNKNLGLIDDTGGNIHEELTHTNTHLQDIAHCLNGLERTIRSQVPPGQVYLVTLNEGMNGMKGFKLVLPLATSKDTQFFEVVYQAGDSQPVTLHPANADYGKEPVTQGEILQLHSKL